MGNHKALLTNFTPTNKMSVYFTIICTASLILGSNAQFYPGFNMGMRPQFPGFPMGGPMAGGSPNPGFNPQPPQPSARNPVEEEAANDDSNTPSSVKEVAATLGKSCLVICEKQKRETYLYKFNTVIDVMEIVRTVMDCPKWCSTAKVAFETGIVTLEKFGQDNQV